MSEERITQIVDYILKPYLGRGGLRISEVKGMLIDAIKMYGDADASVETAKQNPRSVETAPSSARRASLVDYVLDHTERGECKCGQCVDVGDRPDPSGHTIDLTLFKMAVKDNPDADNLRQLIKSHRGEFNDVDPLDGKEHGYIELGGWIGDQRLALLFMGLGSKLGLFRLMSPSMLDLPVELARQMAGHGMVSIIAKGE